MSKLKKIIILATKTYVFIGGILALWFFIRAFTENISFRQSFGELAALFTYKKFVIFIHLVFILVFVLVLLVRYFRTVYKYKGLKIMLKGVAFKFITPILVLYLGGSYLLKTNAIDNYQYKWESSYENTSENSNNHYARDHKFRGMSVFGWHRSNEKDINEIVKNNIEWVAVIPFLYQKDEQTKQISSVKNIGVWTRHDSTFLKSIQSLHEKNVYVMLKPHLWMSSGWRSDISLGSTKEWDDWFDTYRNVILHYATMAEVTKTELFCIGTELRTSILQQPEQWKALIKDIKKIYSGKLTYAANWYDEYEHISFWDELDYIGIQAYFPLTKHNNPELSEIKQGWEAHKKVLETFSKTHRKPILFTEIGYRSDEAATIKPWEWNSIGNLITNQRSTQIQQYAYEAMFESLWDEPWFIGCFLWQWDTRGTKAGALESFDFSPKYKPAQNIMAKWYGNYNSLHK